jgi:hypothetical protein
MARVVRIKLSLSAFLRIIGVSLCKTLLEIRYFRGEVS